MALFLFLRADDGRHGRMRLARRPAAADVTACDELLRRAHFTVLAGGSVRAIHQQ